MGESIDAHLPVSGESGGRAGRERRAAGAALFAGRLAAGRASRSPPRLPVSEKLYSGAAPEGDRGFSTLQALGIRTVITVDGARPDVAIARRFGLRYVHLPFGYDGCPSPRALESFAQCGSAGADLPALPPWKTLEPRGCGIGSHRAGWGFECRGCRTDAAGRD